MAPEKDFWKSYEAAPVYPCNLVDPRLYQHQLDEYRERLHEHRHGTFGINAKTAIPFLEADNEGSCE